MVIIDRLNPNVAAPQVVSDIPLGVAMFASMTSTVGEGLARLYDQYNTIPGDQKYETYGMLYGSSLLTSTMDTSFQDADYAQNMNAFLNGCALPLLARNIITMSDLDVSTDIWALFTSNAQQNRFVTYRAGNTEDYLSCKDAANNLDADMNNQVIAARNYLGSSIFPAMDRTLSAGVIDTTVGASAQELAKISATSSDIIKQAMMMNAMRDAISNPPGGTDTAGLAVAYAQAAAEASQHSTYQVAGRIARENIPLMRVVVEYMLYALFPAIGIMMLLPFGISVLGHFLRALAWINLWPTLYAVMNTIGYLAAQQKNLGVSQLPDGSYGYVLYNAASLYSINAKMEDYAGYLIIMIPVIAHYMVQAGAASGASLVQNLLQPAVSAAGSEGAAVGKGNINQGNMSEDNISHHNTGSWKYDTDAVLKSGFMSVARASGMVDNFTADGKHHLDQSRILDKTVVNSSLKAAYTGAMEASQEHHEAAGHKYAKEAGAAVASVLKDSTGVNARQGVDHRTEEALQDSRDIIQQIKRGTNLTDGQAATFALAASGRLGTPKSFSEVLKLAAGADYKVEGSSALRKLYDSHDAAALGKRLSNNLSITHNNTTGLDAGVVASLDRAQSSADRSSGEFAIADAAGQRVTASKSAGFQVDVNTANYVNREIIAQGGSGLFDDTQNLQSLNKLRDMTNRTMANVAETEVRAVAAGRDPFILSLGDGFRRNVFRSRDGHLQFANRGDPAVDYADNAGQITGGILKPNPNVLNPVTQGAQKVEQRVDADGRKVKQEVDVLKGEVTGEIDDAHPSMRAIKSNPAVDGLLKIFTGKSRFETGQKKDDTSKYPRG